LSYELLSFYQEDIASDLFLRSTWAFEAAIGGYTTGTLKKLFDRRQRAAKTGIFGETAPVTLSVAESPAELVLADALVAAQYSSRGYEVSESPAAPANPASRSQRRASVIIARLHGQVVGTVTIGIDGPGGLRVDEANGEFVEPFRRKGRRLGEVVRLAVATESDSRRVLAALFNAAHGIMTANRLHDVFIEVNPRHAGFYVRALCFEVVGREKLCPRVNAPSVLLKMAVADLTRKIGQLEGELEGFPLS
jgi:hypothetical protein